MSESLPQRIGRYDVLTRLSTGGMAELFLACFNGPGGFRKFVAVKRILPTLKDEDEFIAMFLDEARISAVLSHANICQVFDLGEDADELFIAMEFLAGVDLSKLNKTAIRKRTRLPVGLSAAIMRDACLALHYAHHFTSPSGRPLPVIHRDLSPRNVMVTFSGNTKLIDFGIAKAKGGLSRTQGGRVKGSSAYMSPEQIRGDDLEGTSDLFSAGSLFYELLTGQRIFQGADDVATMYKVLNDVLPPPHIANSEVPKALSEVVLRSLQKDKSRRFPTGRDMAKAIEEACRPLMFDEGDLARWLSENFADAIARSREMLSLAGDSDGARVAQAAKDLKQAKDGEESVASLAPGQAPDFSASSDDFDSDAKTAEADAMTADGQVAPKPKSHTVLIVDDTRVGRLLVESVLKNEGYRVISAESGTEALSMLEQLNPDAMVLDVRMPGMDGFELCEKIRERSETRLTPIVFLSAACSLEERVKGLSVGGDDFIRKPFDGAELVARVKVHLQRVAMLGHGGSPPSAAKPSSRT